MWAAVHQFPLYGFTVWTGATLPSSWQKFLLYSKPQLFSPSVTKFYLINLSPHFKHTGYYTYRVIQEESALLWEMIVWVILSKKVHNEHGSDFERLRSYGHFLIPVHALMWTALTEPAGGLWLTACIASINFASWLAHITSAVHNWAAVCVGAGGVIFENQL